jgi:MFS family permease
MVSALGLDQSLAATMLTLIVAVGLVAGPILGLLTARFPMRRSNLVLGILIFLGIAWTAILVWPAVPPVWLLVVLVVALGIGGPASQIGFDFARTFNPAKSLGSANGIVNVGGFAASFTIMLLIGFILDIHHSIVPDAPLYSLQSFRIAFLIQYVVIGFGVIMLVRARRHTRRRLFDDGGITVGPLWVVVLGALRRGRKQRTGNGSV